MRRSTGDYSYPYMALLSLLSLWALKVAVIRKGESVNNDKSAKGDIMKYIMRYCESFRKFGLVIHWELMLNQRID